MDFTLYLAITDTLNIYPVAVDIPYPIYFTAGPKLILLNFKSLDGVSLFPCNTGYHSKDSVSKSLNRGANNSFETSRASLPQTPSYAKTPSPTKPSEVQNSSSTATDVFEVSVSKAIPSVFLASSHISDDTSELSGLYHLVSFQEVDKSGRQASHISTPLITASRQNGPHSSRRDLATMLAELAGSNSSSQNVQASSTVGNGISPKMRGKHIKKNVFIIGLNFADRA